MYRHLGVVTIVFCLINPSVNACAQEVIHSYGGQANEHLGDSVRGIGDLSGDGVPDFVIGVPGYDSWTGRARVYSGRTGRHLYDVFALGLLEQDQFGRTASPTGDIDGDGVPDIIIGSGVATGVAVVSARVFSGADGDAIHDVVVDMPGYGFIGMVVSGCEDFDGDGTDDFAMGIGIFHDSDGELSHGRVIVYSGVDASILHTFEGGVGHLFFGTALADAGDVDGDGHGDLLVGSPLIDLGSVGEAYLYSGRTHEALHTWQREGLGGSIALAGDVNADGIQDYIVGAPSNSSLATNAGSVVVFSGQDGDLLFENHGSEEYDALGHAVHTAGDFNADGHDDYIAGTNAPPSLSYGYVTVYSGRTGNPLCTFEGDYPWVLFECAVSGLGDVDRDGFDDVLIGGPYSDDNNAGRVSVHAGFDLFLSAEPPNPFVGETLTLEIWEGLSGDTVYLYGIDVDGIPIHKLVDIGTFDLDGRRVVEGDIPPGLAGINVTFRAYGITPRGRISATTDVVVSIQ